MGNLLYGGDFGGSSAVSGDSAMGRVGVSDGGSDVKWGTLMWTLRSGGTVMLRDILT